MKRFAAALLLAGLALGGLAAPAQAQGYSYDDTPRPYIEGPPRAYRVLPPRVGRELGQRCRVRLQTNVGRTRYVCPIVRAKAIGRDCACPPPRGSGRGPYLDGVVIQ